MTNSFPENSGRVGKSGAPADQVSLIHERDAATSQGRQILALEMIADQLKLIARHLGAGQAEPDSVDRKPSQFRGQPLADTAKPEQIPEGIERTWVESYAVGGYNYTNLELAIEEAKRARKRPAANSSGSAHQ